ncbi:MAG: type II toxin-antitoxin system VapC family toxin [Rhodospirillaceae bacterium]|nr:type II toxin-antitoxin system VapC family toxin [Rhodospirillaceae bacterium]
MSFLIDTCALSELVKPKPSKNVCDWFDAASPEALFVSVLTLGEIRKGVEKLEGGRRRARIVTWLETALPAWFEDRVLPVDAGVADEWGRLMARLPRPIPAIDSLIAATAIRHCLAIVTRNESDFATAGVDVLNPWNS